MHVLDYFLANDLKWGEISLNQLSFFNRPQNRLSTLGMLLFKELESSMVVRIVVMLSDTLAGTAVGVIKNVHHDNTTRMTSGTYTDAM